MYDFMLTPEEQELKKEVRRFVREEITSEFLRKMDRNEITYPRDFVEKLAAKGLRGIRFPKKYGGRGMSWVAEVTATEEIGCLGMALGCAFVMPSIVGEALNVFVIGKSLSCTICNYFQMMARLNDLKHQEYKTGNTNQLRKKPYFDWLL